MRHETFMIIKISTPYEFKMKLIWNIKRPSNWRNYQATEKWHYFMKSDIFLWASHHKIVEVISTKNLNELSHDNSTCIQIKLAHYLSYLSTPFNKESEIVSGYQDKKFVRTLSNPVLLNCHRFISSLQVRN